MAKNSDYWKKRFAKLENDQYQKSVQYYDDVQKQFRLASNDIQRDIEHWYQRLADNNGISYAAAKRFLKESELTEFKWTLEQYIEAGEKNALDQRWMKELENASARYHINYLEAMKLQVQQHAELLSTEFDNGITKFLKKSYGDSYYKTAFEIAKGSETGINLAKLTPDKIDLLIHKPWAQDGADFSDRIWSNKEKLINNLHTELSQNIIRGASPKQAIDNLSKVMDVSKGQAGRIIMTESAAISSAAQRDSLKALGVEQYEILATLDSRTSEICRELDGKVFKLNEYEIGLTAPPFHPRCRTTTVPFFDDEFTGGERAARDAEAGKTVYVNGNLSYKEWEQRYVLKTLTKDDITGSWQGVTDYLIRNHKGASDTTAEMILVESAIKAVPKKVQEAIQNGTIIDLGQVGASQYDYERDILYVAGGAEKEDIIHEIGHLVEAKLIDAKNVEMMKRKVLRDVPPEDIVKKVYFDASDNPVEIFLMKSSQFISEYQGRLYVDDWSEIYDAHWNVKSEILKEFISEPFREYISNPQKLRKEFPEMYKLIKEAVE